MRFPLLERMHHKRRRLLKRHGSTTHTSTLPSATPTATPAPAKEETTTAASVTEVRDWARRHGHTVPIEGDYPK